MASCNASTAQHIVVVKEQGGDFAGTLEDAETWTHVIMAMHDRCYASQDELDYIHCLVLIVFPNA
jgi:hypothetical protein